MNYWQKRQVETYRAGEMQVNAYFSKLEKAFNQTKKELHQIINEFYYRYAEENELTYAQAKRQLNKMEMGELQEFIKLSKQNIGKYNQTVNNMSIKARITRYQALEAQVDAALQKLYAMDYQAEAEKVMQEVYQESYYRTWYNMDLYNGVHAGFAQIDPRIVETLLEYPFNGANFSDRLWKQKDYLQTQLMEALTTMLIQGRSPQTLVDEFAKKMNVKKLDAYRLLQTESSYLIGEATHAAYTEDGVEKYQILATLDNKTCGICGALDGKVYALGEEVVGVNMWPFHCFCRCTDTPYYDDTDTSDMRRTARDPDTEKIYEVPADMTYPEWKEQYVNAAKGSEKEEAGKAPEHNKPVVLGTVDFKDADMVSSKLKEYERLIADSPVENAIVITETGKVRQCFGDLKGVYPDLDLGGELLGAAVTHNHPIGSGNEYSFSNSDIKLFMDKELKVLRGIDEKYVYELTRNAQEIDEPLSLFELSETDGDFGRHEKVIDMAKQLGIGYRRWKRE